MSIMASQILKVVDDQKRQNSRFLDKTFFLQIKKLIHFTLRTIEKINCLWKNCLKSKEYTLWWYYCIKAYMLMRINYLMSICLVI